MSDLLEKNTGYGVGLLLTVILIALIVIFILPLSGGLLYTLLINTIVGFIVIFLVNAIFGLGIRYDLLVLIFVAIFGLLAVAILIILNLLGIGRTNRPNRQSRNQN